MSKISNCNILFYTKIKKTMACLQMHYMVTRFFFFEDSATLEAIMSFMPISMDCRKN